MKKKPALVVVIFAALAAGLGLWIRSRRVRPAGLELSGSIEARDAQVGSLVGGRVLEVLVEEGSAVRLGQPLVRLEPDLLDRQIAQQRALVDAQKANLARVVHGPRSEELVRARIQWETAERERGRQEALLRNGLASRQQYDTAAALSRTADQSYRELARGSRAEDVDAAKGALAAEEAKLGFLERQKEELVVHSPADGVIQALDLRPGDLVAASQPVATILEPDQLWVRVYVPEPKLGLVRIGQSASVTVDTFPHRVFTGRVVEIRAQAEYTPRNVQTLDQRSDQVFGVKVAIDRNPALKPGMAAFVHLSP